MIEFVQSYSFHRASYMLDDHYDWLVDCNFIALRLLLFNAKG